MVEEPARPDNSLNNTVATPAFPFVQWVLTSVKIDFKVRRKVCATDFLLVSTLEPFDPWMTFLNKYNMVE